MSEENAASYAVYSGVFVLNACRHGSPHRFGFYFLASELDPCSREPVTVVYRAHAAPEDTDNGRQTMTRETLGRLAGQHPRIRAVAYYFQSIEDPFVCSVGQQRQAIQEWAAEHDIEIMREFSQVGYSQVRHCELDEMLRQWTPQGNEILYVLALRMRRRREAPFRVRQQDRVGHVTMVNLNGSGTIRLVYLQLVNQWDQLHPRTASKSCRGYLQQISA